MFQEGDILCSKYKLKKQFNKGGFSSVWLAVDLKAQADFALKIYDNVEDMEAFRKGFNMVVNLTHSNIFKPLSYDVHEGVPFLVMSYCQKGATSNLIGKMPEDEVWKFVHDVSSGLDFLHEYKGIVHQDIKPGNILIDDAGKYMITDFDISTRQRETKRMTANQVLEMQGFNYGSGTPDYMGPERWPDEGYIPPVKPIQASDIWSLGATIFELMVGEVPFGETGGAYQRKYNAMPDITGNYSKELKKLVRMCLAKDTWNRPTAKQIAESALLHKAPTLKSSKSWKKYSAIGSTLIIVASAIVFLWPKPPIVSEGGMTANDSLFISRIEEAAMIVKEQSEHQNRYDDYAKKYTNMLAEAAVLYKSTDTLEISHDSIRNKGAGLWVSSQSIIDSEYKYFGEREREFREMEADAAADSFAQRRKDIIKYVSDNIK